MCATGRRLVKKELKGITKALIDYRFSKQKRKQQKQQPWQQQHFPFRTFIQAYKALINDVSICSKSYSAGGETPVAPTCWGFGHANIPTCLQLISQYLKNLNLS